MTTSESIKTARYHWPIALLVVAGAALIFTNLGADYLNEDEGDTAVLASNILKFGVPKAWDGVAFIDSDQGARLNEHFVMLVHPWLPYYLTAGSFLLFGQNAFAARFAFALAGWLSILLVYLLTLRISRNRLTASCAAFLLACSIQFLLYARQSRYYTLNIFLTACLLWIFFNLKSRRTGFLFAAVAILSFHAHPYGLVPVFACGCLTLFYRPLSAQRRWFWLALPAIGLFTLPWLFIGPKAAGVNTDPLGSIGEFVERLTQGFIEYTSVTSLIGSALLLLLCLPLARKARVADRNLFSDDEASLIMIGFTTFACYILATAITQSSDSIWLAGIRYASPLLFLAPIIAAIVIVKISRGTILCWLPMLIIFSLTKLPQLTPWMAWNPSGLLRFNTYSVAAHVPLKVSDRLFGSGLWMYTRDLTRENRGTVGQTCRFLRDNAGPTDTIIVNAATEPTYFHTHLPQALSILPKYPIYTAALRAGLPEYLFGIDHVRWIVWRSAWEGAAGYTANELVQQVRDHGGTITQALEMDETLFENREDIHFHRFSDGTYLFRSPVADGFPKSFIGRVDWPK